MTALPDLRGWRPRDAQPAPWHLLLLRAALCAPDEALAAWRAFTASYDFMQIDHGAARLLPLAYYNLKGIPAWDEPQRERLRGIYRYHWARGSRMLHHARRAAQSLRDAGIDVVGIKGCALIPEVYRDPGLRPMQDIDFWIEPSRLDEALVVLGALGWRPQRPMWRATANVSGVCVLSGEGLPDIDLHTRIYVHEAENQRAWSARLPSPSEPWSVPAPADALMHGAIHGIAWDAVAPVRWLADAAMQLRGGAFDRDSVELLVELSRRTRSLAQLSHTLRVLRDDLGVDGLERFDTVRRRRVPLIDRAILQLRSRAGGALPSYVRHWVRYRQMRRAGAEEVRDMDFLSFLTACRGYRNRLEARYRVRSMNRKFVGERFPRVLKRWDAIGQWWFQHVRRPLPVCVIVPVRDRYEYLQEALQSVISQTRPPRRIIVVDDGSTEDIRTAARAVDRRIRVIAIAAAGPAAARNAGVAVAGQPLVAFLDSDDVWLPQKLAVQHAAITKRSDVGMVFCHMDEFICPNATRDTKVSLRLNQKAIMPSGALIRRRVLQSVGDQDATLNSGEFVDWYARARDAGVREHVVEQVLVRRRIHGENRALNAPDRDAHLAGILKRALARKRAAAAD